MGSKHRALLRSSKSDLEVHRSSRPKSGIDREAGVPANLRDEIRFGIELRAGLQPLGVRHVPVRVDETGDHRPAGEIDRLRAGRRGRRISGGNNVPVANDENTALGDDGAVAVDQSRVTKDLKALLRRGRALAVGRLRDRRDAKRQRCGDYERGNGT